MCVASSTYYQIEIHQTSKTFVFCRYIWIQWVLSIALDTHFITNLWSHIISMCYVVWPLNMSLVFASPSLHFAKICGYKYVLRFFVWACPIFLQTMPKIDNLCILFWTCIPTTKLHFIKVVFTIIISTLTKADPFFFVVTTWVH